MTERVKNKKVEGRGPNAALGTVPFASCTNQHGGNMVWAMPSGALH